jgi:hypothetical protein
MTETKTTLPYSTHCSSFVSTSSRKIRNQLKTKKKLNSVASVRKRTIPTERPPPVGEVSANFGG